MSRSRAFLFLTLVVVMQVTAAGSSAQFLRYEQPSTYSTWGSAPA